MKLHLSEEGTWTGTLYDLTVDGGSASFVGSDIYRDRFPAEIALRPESEQQLKDAIAFLELVAWRDSYCPEDVGSVIDDGGSWRVEVSGSDGIVRSSGENAFPSYNSAATTSLHEERFGLLRESIFSAIQLSVPFGYRAGKTQAEQDGAGQAPTRPESK